MSFVYYIAVNFPIEIDKSYENNESTIHNEKYIDFIELEDYNTSIRNVFNNEYIYEIKFLNEDAKTSIEALKNMILEYVSFEENIVELYCLKSERSIVDIKEKIIMDLNYNENFPEDIELQPGKYIIIGNFLSNEFIKIKNAMILDKRTIYGLFTNIIDGQVFIDLICEDKKENDILYDMFIDEDYGEVEEEFILDLTRREMKLDEFSGRGAIDIGVDNILINDISLKNTIIKLYNYKVAEEGYLDDFYGHVLYQCYKNKNLIPKELRGKNTTILRIEGQILNPIRSKNIESIEIKFLNLYKKYPMETIFEVNCEEKVSKKIKYLDPEINEERFFYVHKLQHESGFNYDSKDETKNYEELELVYENPYEDVILEFYNSDFLDEVVSTMDEELYTEPREDDDFEKIKESQYVDLAKNKLYKKALIKYPVSKNQVLCDSEIENNLKNHKEMYDSNYKLELFSIVKVRKMDTPYRIY